MVRPYRFGLPPRSFSAYCLMVGQAAFFFCFIGFSLLYKPKPAHAILPLLIALVASTAVRVVAGRLIAYGITAAGAVMFSVDTAAVSTLVVGTAAAVAVGSSVASLSALSSPDAKHVMCKDMQYHYGGGPVPCEVSLKHSAGWNLAWNATLSVSGLIYGLSSVAATINWSTPNGLSGQSSATATYSSAAASDSQFLSNFGMQQSINPLTSAVGISSSQNFLNAFSSLNAVDAAAAGIQATLLAAGSTVSIPQGAGAAAVSYTVNAAGDLIAAVGSGVADILNTQAVPPFTLAPAIIAQASADASAAQTASDTAAVNAVGHSLALPFATAAQTAATDANSQAAIIAAATTQAAVDAALLQLSTALANAQQGLVDVNAQVAQDLITVQAVKDTYTTAANNAVLTANGLNAQAALYPAISTYSQAATIAANSAVSALGGFTGVIDPVVAQTVAAQVAVPVATVNSNNNNAAPVVAAVNAGKVNQSNQVQSSLTAAQNQAVNNAVVNAPLAFTPVAAPVVNSFTPAASAPVVNSAPVVAPVIPASNPNKAVVDQSVTNANAVINAVDAVAPAVGAQLDQRRTDDAAAVNAQVQATRQADSANMPQTGHFMTVSEFMARVKMSPFISSITNGLSWTDNAGYPKWTFNLTKGPVVGVFTIDTADYSSIFLMVSTMMLAFGGLFAWRIVLG